jgi:hypothetical protein
MIKVDSFKDERQDKTRDELLDESYEYYRENEKLKKKLRKYENPHTPSSKQGFAKPQAEGLKVGRKEGKKSNHNGKTRAQDKPTHIIEVITDKNPNTGNQNIRKTNEYEDRVITNFLITKTVIKYRCYFYEDLNTGEIFMATHQNMPNRGIFGKDILALANVLHYENRVTFEGIANIFTNVFDIPMSAPTALDICNRTAEKCELKYETLNDDIKTSNVVNADETGSNQNGKPEWLWGFFTPTIAFFIFYTQRGGDILEKVLGKKFKGKIGCDGWHTYKKYSEKYGILLQRCWAHLIREVKAICKEKKDLDSAYIWMNEIFDKVKKSREIKIERIRKQKYDELIEELDRWTQVYSSYKETRDLVTLIRNGKEHWFTCVLYPEIEPTNNKAERGIRKFVILEKIMGCLRSEQGKKTTQTMLSLIGTWKLQGLNPYKELTAII